MQQYLSQVHCSSGLSHIEHTVWLIRLNIGDPASYHKSHFFDGAVCGNASERTTALAEFTRRAAAF
jgi:hypothetical protein